VVLGEHLVWHLYHSQQPFAQVRRHHVWTDFPDLWAPLEVESKAEYKRIFKDRVIGEGAFGAVRTLADFEDFAGLDFRTGTITERKQ